ncbi:hypothetical protein OESDEN_02802 [Oesophagostomum dentatum]|uniref:Homeobox domain protein n=1 Tax=Oesophagostomum dentatum TaxID=61180 RepID=A0A0B1TMB0_OESDE|nr:hypothetical protein OESDEN_02802 [Oesophagostomum dentatum]
MSTLTSTLTQASSDSAQEQSSMNEIKAEAYEDQLTLMDNGSESPSSLATPTPTPVNEVDQAIKRALSVTDTSLPVVVTLPLTFHPVTFNNAISLNAVKVDSNGRDHKLNYKVPSAIGLGSCTVRKFPDVRTLPNFVHAEVKPLQNQQTSTEGTSQTDTDSSSRIHKKKKDRPVSDLVTKSGMLRKGRKTYTVKDLQILEEFYLRDPFACANPDKREVLCQMLNIDAYRVSIFMTVKFKIDERMEYGGNKDTKVAG